MNDPLADLYDTALSHGLGAERFDDHVLIAGCLRLSTRIEVDERDDGSVAASLYIEARAPALGDRVLVEPFTAAGANAGAALGKNFIKFLIGTFHVLVEALGRQTCCKDQVEIEHWRGAAGAWQVYTGSGISESSEASHAGPGGDATAPMLEALPVFFARLQTLAQTELPPGPHWLRIYVGVVEGEIIAGEVALDNVPWEAAKRLLREYPWPHCTGLRTLRQFSVLLPDVATEQASLWSKLRQRLLGR